MPQTPDRNPGTSDEEGVDLESTALGTAEGQMRYASGRFSFFDSTGEYDPRSGSGLSAAQHKALRDLIHFIDDGPADGFASGSYKEILPAGDPFHTSEIWYVDNTKAEKIVELTITRDVAQKPTTEVWKMYDTDGSTVLVTLTDTIAYSGAFEINRTRTWA